MAGAILAAAWLAGAAASLAWWWEGASVWRTVLAVAAMLAGGAWAAVSWWRQPAGLLSWDGAAWAFAAGAAPRAEGGTLRVALDLQRALLVRWQGGEPGAPACWLWLERARLPVRWDALRRAVYSRAERDALSGAEPPSARP